ncbi:MAG TPA: 50S ribosomal protein L25 [Solirubrobacteraceae bacterium]|nr:50S ribosomal protein L25 [Solirubrobacteraceae bacterium]
MAKNDATRLSITAREPGSSRATRRLRRAGQVPGVVYGGDAEPLAFSVDAIVLRRALAQTGAVVELELGGETTTAVLKDAQRHPVRGETLHVDFLRVRLDQPIHASVAVELLGVEDAPGVKEGGVLEHVTRELNVEALPGDIPETIQFDASGLEAGATVHLSAFTAPQGVTLLDDLEETIVATIKAPTIDAEAEAEAEEALEEETERVGEGAGAAEGSEATPEAGDVPADAGDAQSE